MAITIQVQSVIYHNDKESLSRAYDSLANAVRINREKNSDDIQVVVHYGDASSEPVYSESDVKKMQSDFAPFFDFQYTFFNENTGTSKGHNRLGLNCSADYLVVMNPDVIVCPRFFEKMLAFFKDESKNAGIVEARQVPMEHPKQYDRETLETEWATGACFMIPTALYRRLDGFDENTFFMYCDDVDLSWRVRLEGKQIYYRPDCPAYHAKRLSSTAGLVPTSAELYYSREAALLMAYKWSNQKLFVELYHMFSQGDEIDQKILAHFDQMHKEGRLPKQLDVNGKVARFVNGNYSEHRFV